MGNVPKHVSRKRDPDFWRKDDPVLDEDGKVLIGGMFPHQREVWELPNFVKILVGGLGSGKCYDSVTQYYDPVAGTLKTVDELGPCHTASVVEATDKIVVRDAFAVDSGTKNCLKITLADGSWISVTKDHPLYSRHGWVKAQDLIVGDLLATPRSLPIAGTVIDPDDEIAWIAYMMADGGTNNGSCAFYKGIPEILLDVCSLTTKLGGTFGITDNSANSKKVSISGLRPLVKKYGIDCLSREKRLPKHWYGFSRQQTIIFLRNFFACDAHFGEKVFEVTLASEQLIRDIRHLLLLLGVRSVVNYKAVELNGELFDAWRLHVSADYRKLLDALEYVTGRQDRYLRAITEQRKRTGHYHKDLVPVSRPEVNTLARHAGVGVKIAREFTSANHKQFLTKSQLKSFVDEFDITGHPLVKHASSDLVWYRITSIEDIGPRKVYDLSVDSDHNFIANNIVGHNTSLGCKWIISMALDNAPCPVATVSPSFSMARRTVIPQISEYLHQKQSIYGQKFQWQYNSAFHEFRFSFEGRSCLIMVLSGDNPISLKGSNISCALIDEPFIQDVKVFTEMVSRVRHPDAVSKHILLSGTPEKISWGYDLVNGVLTESGKTLTEEERKKEKLLDVGVVFASTRANKALDPSYVPRLEATYSAKAAEAYIEGKFVNLSEGLVYYSFEPTEHVVNLPIPPGAELGAGMDFNVMPMACAVFWRKGNHMHFFAEYELPNADTEYACSHLKEKHWHQGLREIFPDATGRNRSTKAPGGKSDFHYIRDAGFDVRCRETNPERKDRYNAVNGKLKPRDGKISLTISPDCKKLIKYMSTYSHDIMHKQESLSHLLDSFSYPVAFLYPLDREALRVQMIQGV